MASAGAPCIWLLAIAASLSAPLTANAQTSVCSRTSAVRAAIIAEAPVSSCGSVTAAHLADIEELDLEDRNISSLKSGDFDGMTGLEELTLTGNRLSSLPADIFTGLTGLEELDLQRNRLSSLPATVFSGLTALEDLHLYENQLTSLPANVFSGLTALRDLDLQGNRLTRLPAGIFSGLSALRSLDLDENPLRTVPSGLFSGLSALRRVDMDDTQLTSLPAGFFSGMTGVTAFDISSEVDGASLTVTVSLEKVGANGFKAVAPTGAPFEMVLPLTVSGRGAISGRVSSITLSAGALESGTLTVSRSAGSTGPVSVDIGTLPDKPASHYGYSFRKSQDLPLVVLPHTLVSTCNRTAKVRDAIVQAAPVSACAAVTKSHLSAITSLSLANSSLSSLQAGDLTGLTGLRTLNLSGNSLSSLPVGIFVELRSLTTLDLSSNQFAGLTAGAFRHLGGLTRLKLQRNLLTEVSAAALHGLGALQELDLSHNQINRVFARNFSGLPSLTSLDLSSNQLTGLDEKALAGLRQLTTFRLQGNRTDPIRITLDLRYRWSEPEENKFKAEVEEGAPFNLVLPLRVLGPGTIDGGVTSISIPAGGVETEEYSMTRTSGTTTAVAVTYGTFPSLPAGHQGYVLVRHRHLPEEVIPYAGTVVAVCSRTTQVRDAIVSAAPVSSCGSVTSRHLSDIVSLSLDDEGITSLRRGDFTGMPLLRTLDLSSNRLSSLPAGVFDGLSKLESLDLDSNRLASLRTDAFYGVFQLEDLDLQSNQLSSLPVQVFSGLTALRDLDLGNNRISTLTSGVFSGLVALDDLSLDHNSLTSLPADLLSGLTMLEEIDLADNQLQQLPSGIFSGLTLLDTIYLDENLLRTLPSGIFSGLTSLRYLYLDQNLLRELPSNIFSGLTSLARLHLFENQLRTLASGTFSGLTSLSDLDLEDNQLTSLPDGIFAGLTSLTKLDVSDNQLGTWSLGVNLQKVGDNQVKAVVPVGSPFEMVLPVSIAGPGALDGGATSITVSTGATESDAVTVARTSNTATAVTADFGTLPSLPANHSGYSLSKATGLPLSVLPASVAWTVSADQATIAEDGGVSTLTVSTGGITFTQDQSLTLDFADGTASAGGDFGVSSGETDLSSPYTVSLTAGSTSQTAKFTAKADTLIENDETIDVAVKLGSDELGSAVVTITDDEDDPAWDVTVDVESIAEDDAEEATLTVSIGTDVSFAKDQSIVLEFSGSATVGDDYEVLSGEDLLESPYTLTLAKETSSVSAIIRAKDDLLWDTPETIEVSVKHGEVEVGTEDLSITDGDAPDVSACVRTTEVRDAIVEASPADACGLVSKQHLAAITSLSLNSDGISQLESNDFSGLDGLTGLNLSGNSLSSLPSDVFDALTALESLDLSANRLSALPADVFDALTALQSLDLSSNQLTALTGDILEELTELQTLKLSSNRLSSLPDDILEGLSALTELRLNGNTVDPIPLGISLEKTATGKFKAVVPAGAPFALALPVSVANGTIDNGATSLSVSTGSVESGELNVTRDSSATASVTANIGAVPALPQKHAGYSLVKQDLPLTVISADASLSALSLSDGKLNTAFDAGTTSYTALVGQDVSSITVTTDANDDSAAVAFLDKDDTALDDADADTEGHQVNLAAGSNTIKVKVTAEDGVTTRTYTLVVTRGGRPVTVAFSEARYLATEDGPAAEVTVELSAQPQREVVILIEAAAQGGATAQGETGADYSGIPASVTIAGTDESASFTITAAADQLSEDGESVLLSFGTLPDGVTDGDTVTATVELSDNPKVCSRTAKVRKAIVAAVADVSACANVTIWHLADIGTLRLDSMSISSLKVGDFSGMTGLTELFVKDNSLTTLPSGVFSDLTALTKLNLKNNDLSSLPADVFGKLTGLRELVLENNDLNSLPANLFSSLTSLTHLNLRKNEISELPTGIFTGLTALTDLNLRNNDLSSLPAGTFSGLSALSALNLRNNTVEPLPLSVTLEKVTDGEFKAVAPAGAPFSVVLPVSVENATIDGGSTSLTISAGAVESGSLNVTRTAGVTEAVTANIGTLPDLPQKHVGYSLVKGALPLEVLSSDSTDPGLSDLTLSDGSLSPTFVSGTTSYTASVGSAVSKITVTPTTNSASATVEYLDASDTAIADADPGDGGHQINLVVGANTIKVKVTAADGSTTRTYTLEITRAAPAVTVKYSAESYTATEGGPAATVTVELSAVPEREVVIPIESEALGGATAQGGTEADYSGIPESVTFSATDTSKSFTVTATSDSVTEDGESVRLTFGAFPDGVTAGDPVTATVRLADPCGRTTQVCDAIISEAGVTGWGDVTATKLQAIDKLEVSGLTELQSGDFSGLTALATLNMSNNSLASLPADIFDGLTALTTLNLSNNSLSSLPAGLFDGLASLTQVDLSGNSTDPLPLAVSLEKVADGQFKAVAPVGAPFAVTLPLRVAGSGLIAGGATTVTINAGAVESAPLTVTRAAGRTGAVAVDIADPLPSLPAGHAGYALAKGDGLPAQVFPATVTPVCNRTSKVRDAIVSAVAGVTACADVTDAQLAGISALDLSGQSISSLTLSAGDFSGMDGLERLVLKGIALSSVPADVFDGLIALEVLNLKSTGLTSLPAGIFQGLSGLQTLVLENSPLGSLATGVFSSLGELRTLNLRKTRLSSLPDGLLDGLGKLTVLNLRGNLLSSLPADAFDELTSLATLNLINNQLTAVPDGIFEGLTQLESLRLDGNTGAPISLAVTLEKVGTDQFKAVLPAGAPFDVALPLTVSSSGAIDGSATSVTVATGKVESDALTVTRNSGETSAVTVNIGAMPDLPGNPHQGYAVTKSPDLPLEVLAEETAQASLSVADPADVTEGANVTITFTVTLSPAVDAEVTVDYATSDDTATAGQDYTAASGTLTFSANQTSATIDVTVLDDTVDESRETFTLKLSNASGAVIGDGEATAAIVNSDPLPQAWLARFGRAVASHVSEGISERLLQAEHRETEVTLAGLRLPFGQDALDDSEGSPYPAYSSVASDPWNSGAAFGVSAYGEAQPGGWTGAPVGTSRGLYSSDLLLGTAFAIPLGGNDTDDAWSRWTVWGRGMATYFAGNEDGLQLDGEVTTFLMGADAAWGRWLAGVALAQSAGVGGYDGSMAVGRSELGELTSKLTSVHPYVRFAVSERLSAWGVLGYGVGELTLDRAGSGTWNTGTAMQMTAAGARGVLNPTALTGGLDLAVRTDVLFSRMTSKARENSAGRLAASQGDAGRMRLILEGSRTLTLAGGRTLMPKLELGLRRDAGDAETGTGLEIGAGLYFTDPGIGLSVDVTARSLVAHQDADYREWGASAAISLNPGASGRGLTLTVTPSWGMAASGLERLWSQGGPGSLLPYGEFAGGGRLDAELGYGLNWLDGIGDQTPYAGISVSETGDRSLRVGWRLLLGARGSFDVEGVRHESAMDYPADNSIFMRASMRW